MKSGRRLVMFFICSRLDTTPMQVSLNLFRAPRPAPTAPLQEPPKAALKAQIARLERCDPRVDWGVAFLGDRRLDSCLPGGGLPRGRWHELTGEGAEIETPASLAGFAARLAGLTARDGVILWALQRDDLHAPGLQGFGLDPAQLIFVRGKTDADVLAIVEDALRTRGIGAVIGETAAIDLTAGKRLQLACERGGASAFMLRRRLYGANARAEEASAATTRWRIAPAPSESDEPGLGAPRWRAVLQRSRGGRTGAWILESDDATDNAARHVRVVAELADHTAETCDGPGLRAGRGRLSPGRAGERRAASGGFG